MRRKYPVGIESFYDIRTGGYVYVDKTKYIYDLVDSGMYYFLSRPRRFGKSLLLSTMEEYFSGNRELFKGLAIEELESDWKSYPVLRLNLNIGDYNDPATLQSRLDCQLSIWESQYQLVPCSFTFGDRLTRIIMAAYKQTGQKVVVLVDEYEQPITDTLDNPELNQKHRDMLRGVYGCLKPLNRYLKFVFMTGVSKIGKLSVFSSLNNIQDISFRNDYCDICGISESELDEYFREDIDMLAAKHHIESQELKSQLRELYDGYPFSKESVGIYNPFSLLYTFDSRELGHYWFASGTPTLLVNLIHDYSLSLESVFDGYVATQHELDYIDSIRQSPIALMYQTGYLTIQSYDRASDSYTLGFPNREVEEGFMLFLKQYYWPRTYDRSLPFEATRFVSDLNSGNISGFIGRLSSFLSSCPYDIVLDREKHFQNVLFILCRLCGLSVHAEYRTSSGRIDMLIETALHRYVFEFKIDQSAQVAMEQIRSKEYALPFASDDKKTTLIGINLSTKTRTIDDYCVESLENSQEVV